MGSFVNAVTRAAQSPMTSPLDPSAAALDELAQAPRSLLWGSALIEAPDVMRCGGVLMGSERAVTVIERAEPDLHQFLPLEIRRPDDAAPPRNYWWLVVRQSIPTVEQGLTSHQRSSVGVWQTVRDGRFVMSKPAIGKAHLWRDPHVPDTVLCSDALALELIRSQISGVSLFYHAEV